MLVLCTGDLHLGRRSSRLPLDVDQHALSCATVWKSIVDYAIGQQVDVVALSGDLVDQANRYYEALGPLERGLRRLHEQGIVTVAVAGNHDYGVLPELALSLPRGCLRLLGVGGRWERTTIEMGAKRLHVDGWSFPTQHVRQSPLASYDLPVASDALVLGLLHADLDVPSSVYAPVTLADLRARSAVSMWLLGHVHAPALRGGESEAPVLYPGSPQPMDPGEPGAHGAWLVDLVRGAPVVPRHIPLASVCYSPLDIDVGRASDIGAARELVIACLRATAAEIVRGGGPLQHLSLRLRLVGRSVLHRQLEQEGRSMTADLDLDCDGVRIHVERVEVATRPARDLETLANGADAASILARLIRDFESDAAMEEYLEIHRALQAIPAVLQAAKPYKSLATQGSAEKQMLSAVLARQADLLLDEILSVKEGVA